MAPLNVPISPYRPQSWPCVTSSGPRSVEPGGGSLLAIVTAAACAEPGGIGATPPCGKQPHAIIASTRTAPNFVIATHCRASRRPQSTACVGKPRHHRRLVVGIRDPSGGSASSCTAVDRLEHL